MPYGYRNRSRSRSFSSSGTVYNKGSATFEVKRHSITRTIEIEPNKTKLIPLLSYVKDDTFQLASTTTAGTKISAQGSKVYPTIAVQDGSLVSSIKLDVTLEPKTQNSSNIIDFYTGRVVTSFHDVAGGQVYGLEPDSSNNGHIKFSDEESSPALTDVIGAGGTMNTPP